MNSVGLQFQQSPSPQVSDLKKLSARSIWETCQCSPFTFRRASNSHLLRQTKLHFDHSPFFPSKPTDFSNSVNDQLRKDVFSFFGFLYKLGKFADGNQFCALCFYNSHIWMRRQISQGSQVFMFLLSSRTKHSFAQAQYIL